MLTESRTIENTYHGTKITVEALIDNSEPSLLFLSDDQIDMINSKLCPYHHTKDCPCRGIFYDYTFEIMKYPDLTGFIHR